MPTSRPLPDPQILAPFTSSYRELPSLQRAQLLVRAKAQYEQLYPEACHGGDRQSAAYRQESKVKIPHFDLPAGRAPSFSEAAADRIACTPRTIQQTVRIGELIPLPLQMALAATPIADRKADLSEIARMAPDQQQRILTRLRTGPAPDSLASANARP